MISRYLKYILLLVIQISVLFTSCNITACDVCGVIIRNGTFCCLFTFSIKAAYVFMVTL